MALLKQNPAMHPEVLVETPLGHGGLHPRAKFSGASIGQGQGWVSDGTWAIRGAVPEDDPRVGPFLDQKRGCEIEEFSKPTGWMWEIKRKANNTYVPVPPLTELLERTPSGEVLVKYLNDKIVNYIGDNVPGLQWFHGEWNSWNLGPAYGVVEGTVVAIVMPMRKP